MPLPIAHSAAGLAGYLAFRNNNSDSPLREELLLLVLCVFLSIAPDLDFIPGFLFGEPGKFHHGPVHSLTVCLFTAFFFYALLKKRLNSLPGKRVFFCFVFALLSHTVLDYFSADTAAPFGLPLFWPFDSGYYLFPLSLFQNIERVNESIIAFFPSLFNAHNGWAVMVEVLFSGIILFALWGLNNYSRPLRSLPCFLISLLCGVVYYFIQIKP